MTTQHAKATQAPRRPSQAGGAVLTADNARAVYLRERKLDLGALAKCFADADESVDCSGKNTSK